MAHQPNPSSSRLDGKVALITGSGRGIGRQYALELASRGASIVVNYAKSASAAEKVVSEIKELGSTAIAIQADVSKPAEITTLFEKAMAHFGHLDIVVSNSGVETFGHISNVTVEEFDRVFAVNTRGQFLVAQAAYKHISNGGRLILQSSISAQARIPNHSVYAGSKAAVEAFARHLSVDFGSKKVTVNAIAPGGIKSDMYTEAARLYIPNGNSLSDEEVDKVAAAWSPLGRVGYPDDIARVVGFLCSEDGAWVNGQFLNVSGGASI